MPELVIEPVPPTPIYDAPMATHHDGARKHAAILPSLEELGRILATCSRSSSTGIRNRALIRAGYSAALRIGEALALRPNNIDPGAGLVVIEHGKGGVARRVGIGSEALDAITAWMERRRRLGLTNAVPLFCTLKGEPLLPSYVRAMLPRLAKVAGVKARVHFHALRHMRARELARRGWTLHDIRMQLGHASVASTSRYLEQHRAPEELGALARYDALDSFGCEEIKGRRPRS